MTTPSVHTDTVATRLADLHRLAGQSAALLPEMAHSLPPLAQDLSSIERLDLPTDRRLMGQDLRNLIEGLERIQSLRQEGFDPQEMEVAIVNISALAGDMRARAAKAIRNEAGEIAIHASVAALHVQDEPHDLTQAFRLIAAAPAGPATDAPGLIIDTPNLGEPNAFGRITGDFVLSHLHKDRKAAPRGAAILPAGSLAHFSEGETLSLFIEGLEKGDVFESPTRLPAIQEVIIAVGPKGAVLHGPAVVAVSDAPNGMLHEAWNAHIAYSQISAPFSDTRHVDHKMVAGGLVGGLIAGAVCAFLFWKNYPESGLMEFERNSYIFQSALGTVMAGSFAGFFVAFLAESYFSGRHKARVINTLPEFTKTATLKTRILNFLSSKEMKDGGDKYNFGGLCPGIPNGILPMNSNTPYNLFPARTIAARHIHDVQVMRPLLALPSPSLHTADIVPLRAAQKVSP